MNNRDWFCLALRLLGIWLFVEAIETIVPYLLIAFSEIGMGANWSNIVTMAIWLGGRSLIGLLLLLFAPAISARFYPSESSTESTHFGEEKLLKVGVQLLGVYALLLAVQSGAGVILGLSSGNSWSLFASPNYNGIQSGYLASLVTCGLNLAFASILLIWNERVVAMIAKFRYIPERDAYEPPPLNE